MSPAALSNNAKNPAPDITILLLPGLALGIDLDLDDLNWRETKRVGVVQKCGGLDGLFHGPGTR